MRGKEEALGAQLCPRSGAPSLDAALSLSFPLLQPTGLVRGGQVEGTGGGSGSRSASPRAEERRRLSAQRSLRPGAASARMFLLHGVRGGVQAFQIGPPCRDSQITPQPSRRVPSPRAAGLGGLLLSPLLTSRRLPPELPPILVRLNWKGPISETVGCCFVTLGHLTPSAARHRVGGP